MAADDDYLRYWHAEAPVFLSPVPPERLYVAPALAPALQRLVAFCQRNQALVLVTGAPGTGKSTLLKWLFAGLSPDTHEILLTAMVRKERGPGWLTPRLAELLGVPAEGRGGVADLLRATAAKLDELVAEKRKLVVAIDAAHLAEGAEAWAELVAFLNLQSLAGTCLSFVLCGDPAAARGLAAAPELAAKLAFSFAVPPLGAAETAAYVAHRLSVAGIDVPFDPEALGLIHARAAGVITQINAFAETCLVEAYFMGARRISGAVAEAAARFAGPAAAAGRGQLLHFPAEAPTLTTVEAASAAAAPPGAAAPDAKVGADDGSAAIKLTSLFKPRL